MKVLIFGSRTLNKTPGVMTYVFNVLDLCPLIRNHNYDLGPITVVDGMATGADTLGYAWAKHNHYKSERFAADWKQYGKRAGYLRNERMANYLRHVNPSVPSLAIGFIDKPLNESKGTKMMYELLVNKEPVIPTYIFDVTTRRLVVEPVSSLF